MKLFWSLCLVGEMIFGTSTRAAQTAGDPATNTSALYPIRQKGLWGYIDRNGKEIIRPQFAEAYAFVDGRARVKIRSAEIKCWTFINDTGALITTNLFEEAEDFSEGLAVVGTRWWRYVLQYIDGRGQVAIPPFFFQDGGQGLIVRDVDRVPYEEGRFSEGVAYVGPPLSTKGRYIGTNGEPVFKTRIEHGTPFSEGLAAVAIYVQGMQKWGYIDHSGKFVILPLFDRASAFHEGLAAVVTNTTLISWKPTRIRNGVMEIYDGGKWIPKATGTSGPDIFPRSVGSKSVYFIDKAGRVKFRTEYDVYEEDFFSEGLCAAYKDRLHGFIDKEGRLAIPLQFSGARNFSEGLVAVASGEGWENRKFGFIDKTGKWVIEPKFSDAASFKDGLAAVQIGGKWNNHVPWHPLEGSKFAYIDKTGKFVWGPSE